MFDSTQAHTGEGLKTNDILMIKWVSIEYLEVVYMYLSSLNLMPQIGVSIRGTYRCIYTLSVQGIVPYIFVDKPLQYK